MMNAYIFERENVDPGKFTGENPQDYFEIIRGQAAGCLCPSPVEWNEEIVTLDIVEKDGIWSASVNPEKRALYEQERDALMESRRMEANRSRIIDLETAIVAGEKHGLDMSAERAELEKLLGEL